MTTASEMVVPDQEYNAYLRRVEARFAQRTHDGPPLFTTDAANLFDLFLAFLPPAMRQEYNCGTCRIFVERYGGLVTIDDTGNTHSVLWDAQDAPPAFDASIRAMVSAIGQANVNGVFRSSAQTWGKPTTGEWHHFAVTPDVRYNHKRVLETASQARAAKVHDYETLVRAMDDFDMDTLRTAVSLLKTESLYRSERVLGAAEWLLDLQKMRKRMHGTQRDNLVWRAVAKAPAGYCHPRNSMIGTLLDDIAEGMDYEQVSARFAAKMHPLQYMRPQSDPGAGNIVQAEKIIAQLDAAGALRRRFARLEEIKPLWTASPQPSSVTGSGVFARLRPRQRAANDAMDAPAQTLTWEKFQRTVLPTARAIDLYLSTKNSYCGMLTASDPNAPLLFQWDNPVSWYVYVSGSDPDHWRLQADTYGRVSAITLKPSMWTDPTKFAHQSQGVILLLDGARDTTHDGLSIFPEFLRSEFHSVRKTLEAFSKQGKVEGADEATACGLLLTKGVSWDALLRVTDEEGTVALYRLDRWD